MAQCQLNDNVIVLVKCDREGCSKVDRLTLDDDDLYSLPSGWVASELVDPVTITTTSSDPGEDENKEIGWCLVFCSEHCEIRFI